MSEDTKLQQLIINTLSPEQMPEVLSETEIYLVEDDAEYATVEELAEKQDKTDNNLVTIDKTVVGAVNELDAKIKEIELYKTPNVLIQGEPTINNGQVTNFSKTNYLILPFEFNVGERGFELTYAFRTNNDVTTPQNLFGSKFSIASYISGGKLTIRVSSNGTSWDILDLITNLDIQANTTYYVKLIFNRLGYTIKYSADGAEYSEISSIIDTRPPFAGDVYIGIGNNQNNPFLGMINLHKWELKYNNSVFWEGMDDAGLATRADISLSNLDEQGEARFEAKQDVIEDLDAIRSNSELVATKQDIISDLDTIRSNASSAKSTVDTHVANDTIHVTAQDKVAWSNKQNAISDLETIRTNASTGANLAPQVAVNTQRIEDLTTSRIPDVIYRGTPKITGGQISNFSTENYLLFPFEDISRGLPFDIYFSFTTGDDVTTQQNIIDSKFGIALAIQNSKGVMALSSNGTNWDIGSAIGTFTLTPNTTYYVKYSWTGTEYKTYISTNNTFDTADMMLPSTLSPFKTTIYIGGCDQSSTSHTPHPFKGIINFMKSRVDVNGITVWEGMADVGIASRANVSLNNLDDVGEARFDAKQDILTSDNAGNGIAINNATGNNIFNKSNALLGYGIGATGIIAPTTSYNCSNYVEVKPNTTYIRLDNTTPLGNYYHLYDENKNWIERRSATSTGLMTTSANTKYIAVAITIDVDINTYQIVEGTEPVPYEPYGKRVIISNTTDLSNYVDLNSAQTITNEKKFNADIILLPNKYIRTASGTGTLFGYVDGSKTTLLSNTSSILNMRGSETRPKYTTSDGSKYLALKDDVDGKQNTSDNNLTTTDKTIVGAINELNAKPSMPSLDDVTIGLNDEDELQSIGTIEKNSQTPIYDWVGTLAEYQEQQIESTHPNWLCYITDDFISSTEVGANIDLSNLSDDGNKRIDNVFRNITSKTSTPPTINNGIVSNMNYSRYVGLVDKFEVFDSPWEMVIKFKTASTLDTASHYVATGIGNPNINIYTKAAKVIALDVGNGSAWTSANILGTTILEQLTWYYYKLQFTGTQYIMSLSTDGKNYNVENIINDNTKIPACSLAFGVSRGIGQSSLSCDSIDFNESYLNIYNKTVLKGVNNG